MIEGVPWWLLAIKDYFEWAAVVVAALFVCALLIALSVGFLRWSLFKFLDILGVGGILYEWAQEDPSRMRSRWPWRWINKVKRDD